MRVADYLQQEEYFQYFDGSNWQELCLMGEYTEWTEVTEEESYQIKEILDNQNDRYGKYKLALCKDGSKYVTYQSYYADAITEDWEKVDSEINTLEEYFNSKE